MTALWIPPALSKAQGKLRSPAPRADLSMMKMAPTEPSRGPTSRGGLAEAEARRLMLSLANSSMLRPPGDSLRDTAVLASRLQTGAGHLDAGLASHRGPLSKVGRLESGWREGWICCCCLQVLLRNFLPVF